tara:strand:- start:80 stop:256 length:177 start_codon:yes stop_codon:yes gene_type:complete
MNILNTQKEARAIKEFIIREQLKTMLPRSTELVDIIFCANEMIKMHNNYRLDSSFKPN